MEKTINAHMPGLCARVVVTEGDKVAKGQEVAVINCMKTEIVVSSEYDGTIKKVIAKEWDDLQVGTPLVVVDIVNEG